ncbi:MAG: hypothetical protein RSB55_06115 [Oscillospiraceae bacterium]
MEVAFYETEHFIRREGNVVNLAEYRKKLEGTEDPPEEPGVDRVPIIRTRRSRPRGLWADYCASGAIVVMVAVFIGKMLEVL